MSAYRICLLPGDGIGPEVISQARTILETLPLHYHFTVAEIGYGAYQKYGTALPNQTLTSIREADASLFGAVTTPSDIEGYFSPVVRMRQTLALYANLRPCRSFLHPTSRPNLDLLIVRENTEGLYAGIERLEMGGRRAVTERVITRSNSERIIRRAFEIARAEKRKKVTVVHKANVLRQTCGLFRKTALEISPDYVDIEMEEMLVDTCAMELIRAPEQFDVIVTTNLFGDILSDEAAMLIGGLGVAHSANIGDEAAIFEPVHGSAPTLAGSNKANPSGAIMAAAMMLDYLDEADLADRVRAAVASAFLANDVTEDLGGVLSTLEMTKKILGYLKVER